MKIPIQVEMRAFPFTNTPILLYSSTPVLQNSSQSLPAKPLNSDLALRTRFSLLNKAGVDSRQLESAENSHELENCQW